MIHLAQCINALRPSLFHIFLEGSGDALDLCTPPHARRAWPLLPRLGRGLLLGLGLGHVVTDGAADDRAGHAVMLAGHRSAHNAADDVTLGEGGLAAQQNRRDAKDGEN